MPKPGLSQRTQGTLNRRADRLTRQLAQDVDGEARRVVPVVLQDHADQVLQRGDKGRTPGTALGVSGPRPRRVGDGWREPRG